MARRAYVIVGTASVAVLAAQVAASLTTGPILGTQHVSTADEPAPKPPGARPVVQALDDGGIPTWLVVSMTVLLGIYVIGLLVLVWLRQLGRKAKEKRPDSWNVPSDANDAWQVVLPVDLGNTAAEQLSVLHLGTPRNAIVACWMALRTATARAGVPPAPAETSKEFMLRAMAGLGLDTPAILALESLYREARFSAHPMTELHRERAGRALEVLADQLADRATGPAADLALQGQTR